MLDCCYLENNCHKAFGADHLNKMNVEIGNVELEAYFPYDNLSWMAHGTPCTTQHYNI